MMSKSQGKQGARMPATKFPQLKKRLEQRRIESRIVARKQPGPKKGG